MKKINQINRIKVIKIVPILDVAHSTNKIGARKRFALCAKSCHCFISFNCTGTLGDTS